MTLNIQNTIRSEALKSKCNQKHGCVITKGNTKIMSVGYNNNHRSSYSISYFKNNKIIKINVKEPCIHAELSGVKNFINIMSKKNKRKMINYNKYIVWVGRIPNDENKRNLGFFKNSEPCIRCCSNLKKLGFRKLNYSTDNGNFNTIDLRYFKGKHISHSQIETESYSKLL